jgi:hypothetical protein
VDQHQRRDVLDLWPQEARAEDEAEVVRRHLVLAGPCIHLLLLADTARASDIDRQR